MSTHQALAAITDEGLFERLATETLREADARCTAVLHLGVNAQGKTRKAPLDGICFVPDANPPHLVAVHHTITAPAQLEAKWLHDPSTVRPRKGGKPTAPAGDVLKTAEIIEEERKRTPALQATLFLTTNEEPDEALVRSATAAGRDRGFEVVIWSRSRIASFLDGKPAGQSIRRRFLNIDQDILSVDLLREISEKSMRLGLPPDNPDAWVPRELDERLGNLRQPITFLVGGSGSGKSVAAYRWLQAHVASSGFALVLDENIVASSATIEQALVEAARQLHPALASGEDLLSFCTSEKPLAVVVEDVQRMQQTQRIVEKIASWQPASNGTSSSIEVRWRLICPVWPGVISTLPEMSLKRIEKMAMYADKCTNREATNAVLARAKILGGDMSAAEAEHISNQLGNDPLFIALHDFSDRPDAHRVIGGFVNRSITRAEQTTGLPSADFWAALLDLGCSMLSRRMFDPIWREIGAWGLAASTLQHLRKLAALQDFLRLDGPANRQYLRFRHDRVRDWILTEALADLDDREMLTDELFSDPYISDIIAKLILIRQAPKPLLQRSAQLNPLALFLSLKERPEPQVHRKVVVFAQEWINNSANLTPDKYHLRHLCQESLEEVEGFGVLDLASSFPDQYMSTAYTKMRNGDMSGALYAYGRLELGINFIVRDRHAKYAIDKYRTQFIVRLNEILLGEALTVDILVASLRLAGKIGSPELRPAIKRIWRVDSSRGKRLDEYLYAAARCCDANTALELLGPICEVWAALPNERDAARPSRYEVMAHTAVFAFQYDSPRQAVSFLVDQARGIEPLRHPLNHLLSHIDDPIAVLYIVDVVSGQRREGKWSPWHNDVSQHWARSQEHGRPMSTASRRALEELIADMSQDGFTRRTALNVWAATELVDDIAFLSQFQSDPELHATVLHARLDRHDPTAVPDLIEKIQGAGKIDGWWFAARHVWCGALSSMLADTLSRWNTSTRPNVYAWHLAELFMIMPRDDAANLLIRYWPQLKAEPAFVQAALFVGGELLVDQAHLSIREAENPASMLELATSRLFGRANSLPAIRRETLVVAYGPILDLLKDSKRSEIIYNLNELGWHEEKIQLFGENADDPTRSWHGDAIFERLNEIVDRDAIHWLDRELDGAIKMGVNWRDIVGRLPEWLTMRPTLKTLSVAAWAVRIMGSRADLSYLHVPDGVDPDAAQAIIHDATYAVKRRSAV